MTSRPLSHPTSSLLTPITDFPTQGGLNLNIFGALSGAFSGKRKTTKNTNADGSSIEVVDEEGQGHARGAGAANMNAYGAAQAQADERRSKQQGAEQKKLAGSSKQQKQVQQVDHLGIEGAK